MRGIISLKEASKWASNYLDRPVTTSNINYLIQYAKLRKYMEGLMIRVNLNELKEYYDEEVIQKQQQWKKKLG